MYPEQGNINLTKSSQKQPVFSVNRSYFLKANFLPVSNSHETLANVAKVAVKAPTITLPKNGVSVLENIRPSH